MQGKYNNGQPCYRCRCRCRYTAEYAKNTAGAAGPHPPRASSGNRLRPRPGSRTTNHPEAGTQEEKLAEAQIQHLIKMFGNMTDRLQAANLEDRAPLHADFGLELEHHANQRAVIVQSQPADWFVCESEF
ncbi:hypothetical protein AB0D04_38675 [Streptomyces sp. NPDC048483]|uniref:hypothetical protein n=1 Tax=Streptomyces sp. NPDC048483 TaxID=3154927 RepID=UPI0034279547